MCRPTTTRISLSPTKEESSYRRWFETNGDSIQLFPLHPSIAVAAMAYFLPSWCYLNRGFTVWFHLATILQVLTQSKFLVKVLALTGASICLGWYASLAYEFFYHGRWCHALYKNMPTILVNQMVHKNDSGALDFESTHSLVAMAICHLLDFLGHPILACYFWAKIQKDEKHCSQNNKKTSNRLTIEWPVILSSYCFSRCWSLVHTHHNFGKAGLFYFGFDVYVIDDLDAWYPAYIVESLFYGTLVVWKLTHTKHKESQKQQYQ